VSVRARIGLDDRRERQLAWVMELCLVGLLFVGLYRLDVGVVVNTAVALGVTQLPPLLERDVGIPMDAGLTLWITTAVFLHALGTVGLPGSPATLYASVWWYDHLTHALSASIVAAAGYATARAVDEHSESVSLPPEFTFVFVLVFVVAFGVFWEVIEFALGELAAVAGVRILTQYGLEDTMFDLLFDLAGGVVVATWGTAHLTGVVDGIVARFDRRRAGE
jgi:hypothetical protein